VSSGTVLDTQLLLQLRAAPRPLGSLLAAFHHAERTPRVISSLTAESPTIQKLQNILSVDIGIPATRVPRARLVKALRDGVLWPRCEAGPTKHIEHIEHSDVDADEATNGPWKVPRNAYGNLDFFVSSFSNLQKLAGVLSAKVSPGRALTQDSPELPWVRAPSP
jgi:hypothetical protein